MSKPAVSLLSRKAEAESGKRAFSGRNGEKTLMMKVKAYPTLLLAFMGSMDCLTTVIGIMYFGAVELNPFLAGVVSTNLPAFVILKLTTTVFVCLIFRQAEKILMQAQNKSTRAFSLTHKLLKLACAGVSIFLVIVVLNNMVVLLQGA